MLKTTTVKSVTSTAEKPKPIKSPLVAKQPVIKPKPVNVKPGDALKKPLNTPK